LTATRKPQPRPATRRPHYERAILRAALEELALADFGGLSIERVAERAGVNKTTIYRRWPTKSDLLRDAVMSALAVKDPLPAASSGSLREDLLGIGQWMLRFLGSFEGQSLIRLRLIDHPQPELAAVAKSSHDGRREHLRQLLLESVARGELASANDVELVLDVLFGWMLVRQLLKNERIDDVLIARVVDILSRGASKPRRER